MKANKMLHKFVVVPNKYMYVCYNEKHHRLNNLLNKTIRLICIYIHIHIRIHNQVFVYLKMYMYMRKHVHMYNTININISINITINRL